MTEDDARIAPPVHIAGPHGPWHQVQADMDLHGHATICTTQDAWLPALAGDADLRALLGRDWQRYRRIPDPATRSCFAASRLAVKYTAGTVLGLDPADIDLAYRIGGRPYLRGFDQIDLSLTHSAELIAVGISRLGRIGVDTEPADRRTSIELLQDRVCTLAEKKQLAALPESEQGPAMLRLWTLKEAYTKAIGQGLALAFTEFGFSTGTPALLTPDGSRATHGEWAFHTFSVRDRHLVSVACQDQGLDPSPDTQAATMLDDGYLATVAELITQNTQPLTDP